MFRQLVLLVVIMVVLLGGGLKFALGKASDFGEGLGRDWVEDALTGQTAAASSARISFVPKARKSYPVITKDASDDELVALAVEACDVADRHADDERPALRQHAHELLPVASSDQVRKVLRLALRTSCAQQAKIK